MSGQEKHLDNRPPLDDTGEKATLTAYLGYLRRAVLAKVEDLDAETARRVAVPSGTSLLGLVKHLTTGERYWLGEQFAGEDIGPADFGMGVGPHDTVADVCAAYRDSINYADAIIAAAPDLEQRTVGLRDGATKTLRWVIVHLIEETARHAGHADILREQADGSIGR